MMQRATYAILIPLLLLLGVVDVAASDSRPTVRAAFSRDSVEVGDRVELILDIDKDRAAQIGIPRFDDALSGEQRRALQRRKAKMSSYEEYDEDLFELIAEEPLDTISEEGRKLHLRKRYHLAVMETGAIPIRPAILYFERNRETPDTIYVDDTLMLYVRSYAELDTTLFLKADPASQQGFGVDRELASEYLEDDGLYELKTLPFIFAEIRDYVTYGAIIAVLLALVVWVAVVMLRRWLAHRATMVKPVVKLPAHIVANKALVELNNRKLWQNGKFKQYYTSLASILRVYISDRWAIGALEMTTDEIISALVEVDIAVKSRSDLVALLRMADMVKFAKAEPDAEENELNYTRAYYFVENTKLLDEEKNEGKSDITIETNIED